MTLTNLASDRLQVNNKPVAGPVVLNYDGDTPDTVTVDRISFFVIKRVDRLALRAKDKENPVLEHFTGISISQSVRSTASKRSSYGTNTKSLCQTFWAKRKWR